jgi:hypothetical protein
VGGATCFRDFTAELLMPEVLMCSLLREDGGGGRMPQYRRCLLVRCLLSCLRCSNHNQQFVGVVV